MNPDVFITIVYGGFVLLIPLTALFLLLPRVRRDDAGTTVVGETAQRDRFTADDARDHAGGIVRFGLGGGRTEFAGGIVRFGFGSASGADGDADTCTRRRPDDVRALVAFIKSQH